MTSSRVLSGELILRQGISKSTLTLSSTFSALWFSFYHLPSPSISPVVVVSERKRGFLSGFWANTTGMTSTLPPLVQAVSGAVGSASASALTYPLDLITTRLQLDSPVKARRRGGIVGGLKLLLYIVYGSKKTGKKGLGWKALYDGLGSDLFATVLSNFFYFYFYSFTRSIAMHGTQALPLLRNGPPRPHKTHKPSLLEDILLGFVSGVASRAVSTPLNIITLRLQAERADAEDEDVVILSSGEGSGSEDGSSSSTPASPSRSSSPLQKDNLGFFDIARLIHEEHGWKGFWKGFGTSALLSINPSITLAFFQLFRKFVVYSRTRSALAAGKKVNPNLKPWEAFFVGAIATSIANTILYPLILAKKRLQARSGAKPGENLLSVLVDAYTGMYDPHSEEELSSEAPSSEATTNGHVDADPTKRPPLTRRSKGSRYYVQREAGKPLQGPEGLYQGLQMQLLKGFFNQGMTFLVKGR
ncbi:adenine nucleotide transporter, variant 2 [Coprinopsis cinerea AmutBmut pab1-1]|nr:adenine nucleotide transporter, variant 2 [Coprinopsis cinerea AmutBmut pab1-1]